MKKKMTIPHPHPGETLYEDFMKPLGLTAYRLAKDIKVPQTAISQILRGERGISPEMALRLEAYTGASAQFWINLQSAYDLDKVRRQKKSIKLISKIHAATNNTLALAA